MRRAVTVLFAMTLVSCQTPAPEEVLTPQTGRYALTAEDQAAIEAGIDRSSGRQGSKLVEATAAAESGGGTYVCGTFSTARGGEQRRFIGKLTHVSSETFNTVLFTVMDMVASADAAGLDERCKVHGVM